jgi:hypothetical protein
MTLAPAAFEAEKLPRNRARKNISLAMHCR